MGVALLQFLQLWYWRELTMTIKLFTCSKMAVNRYVIELKRVGSLFWGTYWTSFCACSVFRFVQNFEPTVHRPHTGNRWTHPHAICRPLQRNYYCKCACIVCVCVCASCLSLSIWTRPEDHLTSSPRAVRWRDNRYICGCGHTAGIHLDTNCAISGSRSVWLHSQWNSTYPGTSCSQCAH